MKISVPSLILFGILLFSGSCVSNVYERKARADAESFLKNVDSPEVLMKHPMVEPDDIPKVFAEQNKKRNLESLKSSIQKICGTSRDYKLVETYRKIGDDDKKFLALEYELCNQITIILGYDLVGEDGVILQSIWPMNKEDRPKEIFAKEKSW
jgi:hypothetical protein